MTTIGLPAGTYYIRVQSRSSYSTVSNCKYGICVNYTEADNWEQEFNEDVSTSNQIEVNNTYYGTIRHGYDYENERHMRLISETVEVVVK